MVRLKQSLVAVIGVVVAAAMIWLGLWQMQVFQSKEDSSALARAAQPAVSLVELVGTDGEVGDVFGRQVYASGAYVGEPVLVEDAEGTVRVVSAFQITDGRLVPVVRGSLTASGSVPLAPSGEQDVTGIFLPSEPGADHEVAVGRLGAVRLPLLAQLWPGQLTPGFITLDAAGSAAQGLEQATVSLPSGEGSATNAGYALQWWVFAGFAIFMTWRFIAVIGRQGSLGRLGNQEDS